MFQNVFQIWLWVQILNNQFFKTMAFPAVNIAGILTVSALVDRFQVVRRVTVLQKQGFFLFCDFINLGI